jgi:general secretion pathway protein G
MKSLKLSRPLLISRRAKSRGFTLLEIMVVVIIIGTIASLVGVKVLDRLEQSRVEASKAQMSSIKSGLDLFKMDNGFYPPTDIGLQALVGAGTGRFSGKGYLNSDTVPLDPWQVPYGYVSDGNVFTIWSSGPDRTPQTQDDIQG